MTDVLDTPHYLLLHGAFTNAGDHLICDRAKALFSYLRPDRRILLRDRRIPFDLDDSEVRTAAAIVLLGGPAWQRSTYPKVYPLSPNLDRITPPIVPIGVGWRSESVSDASSFAFDEATCHLLNRIENDGLWGSTRDATTLSILSTHGLSRQLMSGCPSWYDIGSLERPPVVPDDIRAISYSVGARSSTDDAFVDFEREILAAIRARYPVASIRAVFHHPIDPTSGYPDSRSERHRAMASQLARDGIEVVDVSGSSKALIHVHADADLHVGLRVHAHLARCSRRQPSVLLAEDARAHVMCQSLGHVAFDAVDRGSGRPMPNYSVWSDIETHLNANEAANWPQLRNIAASIDSTFHVMSWVLSALP